MSPSPQLYRCEFCKYKMVGKGKLIHHSFEEHENKLLEGIKLYGGPYGEKGILFWHCKICGEKFKQKENAKKHMVHYHEMKMFYAVIPKSWKL